MIANGKSRRVDHVLDRREQLLKELASVDSTLSGLLGREMAHNDPEHAEISRKLRAAKQEQHRIRKTAGRKRFSRKCHLAHVARIDKELLACQKQDDDMQATIADLERRLKSAESRIGATARAELIESARRE